MTRWCATPQCPKPPTHVDPQDGDSYCMDHGPSKEVPSGSDRLTYRQVCQELTHAQNDLGRLAYIQGEHQWATALQVLEIVQMRLAVLGAEYAARMKEHPCPSGS